MKNINKAMAVLIVLAVMNGGVLAQQDKNKNAPKDQKPKVIVVDKNDNQQDQEQKSKDDKDNKRNKDKKPSE